jgi:cyclic pyranopterin phosphate synthase
MPLSGARSQRSRDTYCGTCDRLRVASDGTLRPCLATNDGVEGMYLAAKGDVQGLVRAIGDGVDAQARQRTWKGCTEPTAAAVSMRAIGG